MKKIAFRVDGGKEVGMGHVMRSLSLASAFPDEHQIIFIVNDEDIKNYLQSRKINLEVVTIDNDEEINELRSLLRENEISILITDSYNIDQQYLLAVKKEVDLLVSIHDFVPFPFPSDIVINGNVYAEKMEYESLNDNTEFLLGIKYLLMKNEFVDLSEREISKDVRKILITVGGGDPLNITPKIIKSMKYLAKHAFINKDDIHFNVVIGPAFSNKNEIVKVAKEVDLDITLHLNVHKMGALMLDCDLAVSAGGSTLYELAAAGTPAVAILQAENQIQGAKALENRGTIINLGLGDKVGIKEITRKVSKVINSFELRKKMSTIGQQLVDGRGADRCVQEILKPS